MPAEPPAGNDRPDLRLGATVGDRDAFEFRTADGLDSPDAFRTPELRLLDVLAETEPESVLVPEANYGVVGVVMAAFADRVRMTETSARAAQLCRHNAARNRVDDRAAVAITGDPRALPRRFEAGALAPAGYTPCEVIEERLAGTVDRLEPGGTVYLAAAPTTGLARYRRTLKDLCADVETVDDRDDWTVLKGTRPAEFDPPRYAEPRTIRPTIDGVELSLVTYPGLFSDGALDAGTRRLAERLRVDDGERVLDLACGYGPLGIYAARTADCRVTLSDDDRVATACAHRSVRRTGVEVEDIVTADGVAGVRGQAFDRIVCNPPTHAGGGVLRSLMRGARAVLADAGRLDLVHHRGVAFDRYLEPYFGDIGSVERGEYRLVTARH